MPHCRMPPDRGRRNIRARPILTPGSARLFACEVETSPVLQAARLLAVSNPFMIYAWSGHLRDLGDRPGLVVAVIAWGVAFFESPFQVPANRIGYAALSLPQRKILPESISLLVFIRFSIIHLPMKAPIGAADLWASLCILGAVFFVFRSAWLGAPQSPKPRARRADKT